MALGERSIGKKSWNCKTEIAIGLLSFLAIGLFYSQMIAAALAIAGHNRSCPWPLLLGSMKTTTLQQQASDRMRVNSRLVRRDPAALELWETPRGRFWIPEGSSREVFHDLGEQDRRIYTIDGHGVRAGDIVLDCGANVGVYTREALKRGASQVVAIEPVPQLVECLRRNFEKEIRAGQVIVYSKGVWDKEDVLPMHLDPDDAAGASFLDMRSKSQRVVNLPLTTIDCVVSELGLPRVDSMKFDIEGAERRAIVGARETIRKFRPRMAICVYHLPDDHQAIPAAVAAVRNDYRPVCGPCLISEGLIFPEVFFFE